MNYFKTLALCALIIAQVRLGIRVLPNGGGASTPGVIQPSDLTYDGAIRMPTSGTDTTSSYGGMAGRVVSGNQRLFVAGDAAHGEPDIYEISVQGLTPNTTIASAPRAALVKNWGDISGSKRESWNNGVLGDPQEDSSGFGLINSAMYWNETTQLLYFAWRVNYTDVAMWSVAANDLSGSDGPSSNACGPWRFTYPAQSPSITDGTRTHGFMERPSDGKMLSFGVSKSGNATIPWGPSLRGGNDWPTCSTTGGFGMTPINEPDLYLDHYIPNGGTFTNLGVPSGTVRQMKLPSTFTYAFENYGTPALQSDPAVAGFGTWSDENSSANWGTWIEGTNKSGVIFVGTVVGSAGSTISDCTNTTHSWYRNAANGWVRLTGSSGTFTGTLTGGTSGATGSITGNVLNTDRYIYFNSNSVAFTVGETATASGGGSGVVAEYINNVTCNHLCACVQCATGPSVTRSSPALIIYDPDDLEDVQSGATADEFAVAPDSVTDMSTVYSIQTAGQTTLQAKKISGGYYNPTTHKLYLEAPTADCSRTGNCNFPETLIHVFTVDDSPAPVPAAPWPVLSFAFAGALWSLGALLTRRPRPA